MLDNCFATLCWTPRCFATNVLDGAWRGAMDGVLGLLGFAVFPSDHATANALQSHNLMINTTGVTMVTMERQTLHVFVGART